MKTLNAWNKITAIAVLLLFSFPVYSQEQPGNNEADADVSEIAEPEFNQLVNTLTTRSFSSKAATIESLGQLTDPRVLPTLKSMLDGKLYYRKSDKKIVAVEVVEEGLALTDVVNNESLGVVGKREAKKIGINNKLRNVLKASIAVLELGSDDKALRLASAQNLLKSPDPDLLPLLEESSENETSESIKHLLDVAIAILKVDMPDQKQRLAGIELLATSVEPEAVNKLRELSETAEDGTYLEKDIKVAELAEDKLKTVESKLAIYRTTENLFFGLSLGSVFLLAAIGLAITFGVMGVINMAHGEMIMIGAYTTFFIQSWFPNLIEVSLIIAIPAAFLVSGAVGVLIERTIIRHLYGRPLDTLLATFGVGLILQQAARTYNSNNVPVITPSWLSSAWAPNGAISFNFNRLYILAFSLIVLFSLALLLKKTLFGLQMRAVTQNRPMASSMGIKQNWVDALTFGLGSGIAGIAGVALSQITNVGPNLGSAYIIDSFMVVVFGGVGSLIGTFFGAFGLGVINKFLEPSFGAVVGKIMVLIFIILFIQWRPRGLFALKGRFVED